MNQPVLREKHTLKSQKTTLKENLLPITAKQLEERRKGIGSSDVPAIVGMSPWQGPVDIYHSKVYALENQKDSMPMTVGNYLEGSIAQWAIDQTGIDFLVNPPTVTAPDGINRSNPDGIAKNGKTILEIKAVSICHINYDVIEEWGAEMSEEIPEHVMIQVQHQMAVTGAEDCYVAGLIAARGFRLYHVKRDPTLCELLLKSCVSFWEEFVLKKIPPGGAPLLSTVKRIPRVPNKVVEIKSDTVVRWQEKKAVAKEAKEAEEEAKAMLLEELGDAESGECLLGTLTYMKTARGWRTMKFKEA